MSYYSHLPNISPIHFLSFPIKSNIGLIDVNADAKMGPIMILAGGAIPDMIKGKPPKDLDLFIPVDDLGKIRKYQTMYLVFSADEAGRCTEINLQFYHDDFATKTEFLNGPLSIRLSASSGSGSELSMGTFASFMSEQLPFFYNRINIIFRELADVGRLAQVRNLLRSFPYFGVQYAFLPNRNSGEVHLLWNTSAYKLLLKRSAAKYRQKLLDKDMDFTIVPDKQYEQEALESSISYDHFCSTASLTFNQSCLDFPTHV